MRKKNTISRFISQRMTDYRKSKITALFIRLSFFSVVLSVMIMVFSTFLISGFKKELEHRMAVLYGDLVITESSDLQNEFSEKPNFAFSTDTLHKLGSEEYIAHIEPYMVDFTMLKKGKTPLGVMVKAADFEQNAAEKEFLVQGRLPKEIINDSILYEVTLSKNIAEKIQAHVGEQIIAYFSSDQQNIKIKKLKIVGLYNSSVYEHDDAMIWTDLSLIQSIRGIPPEHYHAIGLILKEPENYAEIRSDIWTKYLHNPLMLESINDRFGYITDWIKLQKTNEYIILIIMFVIALINMISCILILILDRLPMIGSLKAIGASDATLQRVFLNLAQKIILRGILWGNIIAILLAFLQQKYHLMKLPEQYYLIPYVPISFDWTRFVVINLSFFVLLSIALIVPTLIIRRMRAVQIMKYK